MAHRLAIYRDFIVHRDVDRPATEFEPRALAERGTININGDNNRLHPVLRVRSPLVPLVVFARNFTLLPVYLFSFKTIVIFVMIRVAFCYD